MTNLLIGFPDIPQAAVKIESNNSFATNTPIHNLRSGERYQIGKLAASTGVLTRINYDLGSTTKAANFFAIARADLLRLANIARVVVRGSTVSPFSPSNIAGLKGWWDFTRNVTTSTGISQVDDQSGNGNHATQGTGSLQPILSRGDNIENAITYSEAYSNVAWDKTSYPSSVVDNFTTDYAGNSTAGKVTATAGTSRHGIEWWNGGSAFRWLQLAVGASAIIEVDVKAGTHSSAWIGVSADSPWHGVEVNLSNGTFYGAGNLLDSKSIASLGNGWYRVTIQYTATANHRPTVGVWFGSGVNNTSPPGIVAAGTETLYVARAQLRMTGTDQTYITTTSTPAFASLNDNKCAVFEGSNDYLSANAVATSFTGTDKPYTFFVVAKQFSLASTVSYGGFGRSTTNTPYIEYQVNNGTQKINWGMRDDASLSPANIASSATLSPNSTVVWTFKTTGTTATLYRNGVLDTSAAFDVGTVTLDRFTLGAWGGNTYSNYFNGRIGEALIFDSALSDTDRQAVEAYLISKWSTTAPGKTNTLQTDTLYGQRSKDFYTTFTTSSAFRHWWIDYEPQAAGQLEHSKFYLGSYHDFGKDPDDLVLEKIEVKQSKMYAPSGAVMFAKNEQTKYRVSITWRGVTDDSVRDFMRNVANQAYRNRGVFLMTTSDHNVLDGQRILHCKLTEVESESEKVDYNNVSAVFEEIIG